jgi:hypothetical protein
MIWSSSLAGAAPVFGQAPSAQDSESHIAELRAKLDKLDRQLARDRQALANGDVKILRRLHEMETDRMQTIVALINCLRDASPLSLHEQNTVLTRMLTTTIETKGLQEKVKLKTALEYFADKFGGRLPILIDRAAFGPIGEANTTDPYEEDVSLPPAPTKMAMDVALRLVLAQVAKGEATFLVRRGYIEITSRKASAAVHYLYRPSILLTFKQQPLQEVLDHLSDETGIDIHLDPKVGDKAKAMISARFRNTTLEDALVTVTEMADLKFVVLERSIFVTTPERAVIMRKEEKERESQRKELTPKSISKAKRLEPAS